MSTHLPASDTKGLASAANGQGAFPHAGEGGCSRSKRAAAEMEGRGGGWTPVGTQALNTLNFTKRYAIYRTYFMEAGAIALRQVKSLSQVTKPAWFQTLLSESPGLR